MRIFGPGPDPGGRVPASTLPTSPRPTVAATKGRGSTFPAAAPAPAAAQHGVAGDPAAHPGRVDALADRGDRPAPFMSWPHRIFRVALVQVGHLAGEELDIGPADAGQLDVDDGLAGSGRGARDVRDDGLPRAGDDESSHDVADSATGEIPAAKKRAAHASTGQQRGAQRAVVRGTDRNAYIHRAWMR